MKKFAGLVVACVVAILAAASFVPGFWSWMPGGMASSARQFVAALPEAAQPMLLAALNLPEPKPGEAKPAANAGSGGGGRSGGGPGGAGGRPTPVAIAEVVRKAMPYRVDSIGTVQTIASVTVRSRVDSQIEEILFADGANVKAGDLLARLDSRVIEAQIRQGEATVLKDRASLDLARATLKRAEELAAGNFATRQRLDEARASVSQQEASLRASEASLEVLKTQLTFYTIRAPITGKAGLANIKPGNMARSSDGAIAITTINQIAPIYVSFSLPQRYLQDIRQTLAAGGGLVTATPQGGTASATGRLELVENAMDNATGTIGLRALFDNKDELLWPGLIVSLKVVLREDKDVIVVPREAVQMSQRGNFVFVVKDGVARMQPVTVGRSVDNETIVLTGLEGREQVIVDGQLLVVNGGPVQARPARASQAGDETPKRAL